jgi:hypothetical protein
VVWGFSALLLACTGFIVGLISEPEDGKRRVLSEPYSVRIYNRAMFIHICENLSPLLATLLLPS